MTAKTMRRKTTGIVTTAADRPSSSRPTRSVAVTESDIASYAYKLYCARDGKHGHDMDDWLQAERDLRDTASFTAE